MERLMPAIKAKPVAARIDPKMRPVDGMAGRMKLENRDPDKHYVWVEEHGHYGTGYWESLGYERVTLEDGGVRPVLSNTTRRLGDVVTSFGMILMACPLSFKQELDAYGQQEADSLERRIITRRGGIDYLRGIGLNRREPEMTVEATTSPLTPVSADI
jgi:hypothetical protein